MNVLETEMKRLIIESLQEVMEQFMDELVTALNKKAIISPTIGDKLLTPKDPLSIIRPSELAKILSISTTTLWRMEQDEQLPEKIQIGTRSVGLLRRDVEDWISKKIPEFNQQT